MSAPGVNAANGYDTLGLLCDVLETWCSEQGLPYTSADELVLSERLTTYQVAWLTRFGTLWDTTQEGRV